MALRRYRADFRNPQNHGQTHLRPPQVTLLALTALSELNAVGEISFYSLRRSTGRVSASSIEACALYLSFLFSGMGLRKITMQVRESDIAQFASAVGLLLREEGRLERHLRKGDAFEDVMLLAIWQEDWLELETEVRPWFLRWQ